MSGDRSATNARPLAVVTGASSGIGADLAGLLAAAGHDLVLVARRTDRLLELAERLAAAHGVTCIPLTVDLARGDECDRLLAALERDRMRLSILVNNAGFGTHGFFHETPRERSLEMIDVNCRALTHLTSGVLPWMVANTSGRILNVASVAAFQPGPLMAVYYASKAYVLSFSEALSNECEGTGVTVTAVCPGPTITEFTAAAGFIPHSNTGAPPMSSEDVARISFNAMMRGTRREVTGRRNKFVALVSRLLPRGALLRIVRGIQERRWHGTRVTP